MADHALPDGWALKSLSKEQTLVHATGIGYVTIDWERRGFRAGFATHGPFVQPTVSARRYQGRGWRKTLLDDAIAWLQDVLRAREP